MRRYITKTEEKPVRLGMSSLRITPLGLGTWTWDSSGHYGTGRDYSEEDLRAAFRVSRENGINFYDTAESYGNGSVERLFGKYLRESKAHVMVATKFAPWRYRFLKRHLLSSLRGSLERLGLEHVDLYQTHFHFRFVPVQTWMNALADAVAQGLTTAVGTANYNAHRLRMAHRLLATRGIPLASTQTEYSLLHRHPESDGLVAACEELHITVLAYSPLAMGVLSGKFTPSHPPPGERGRRYDPDFLGRIQPLIGLMKEVGQSHGGKTPAQIALNWLICKGAIPIHGAKNARQAEENSGALGWRLRPDEVGALDHTSQDLQR